MSAKCFASYFWKGWLFWLAILGLFLTACGADVEQTITFKRNEAWQADIAITFSSQTAAIMGGLSGVENRLEETIQDLEAVGVTASFEPGRDDQNNPKYTLHLNGQGFQTLEQIAFSDGDLSVETANGQRQIHVLYNAPNNEGNFTITLIGGKVISSNGEELGGGRVRWVNPTGHIEAVLTERSPFNVMVLLAPVGIILLAIVGGVALSRNQGARCLNCGNRLSPQAIFCNNCGHPREVNY